MGPGWASGKGRGRCGRGRTSGVGGWTAGPAVGGSGAGIWRMEARGGLESRVLGVGGGLRPWPAPRRPLGRGPCGASVGRGRAARPRGREAACPELRGFSEVRCGAESAAVRRARTSCCPSKGRVGAARVRRGPRVVPEGLRARRGCRLLARARGHGRAARSPREGPALRSSAPCPGRRPGSRGSSRGGGGSDDERGRTRGGGSRGTELLAGRFSGSLSVLGIRRLRSVRWPCGSFPAPPRVRALCKRSRDFAGPGAGAVGSTTGGLLGRVLQ